MTTSAVLYHASKDGTKLYAHGRPPILLTPPAAPKPTGRTTKLRAHATGGSSNPGGGGQQEYTTRPSGPGFYRYEDLYVNNGIGDTPSQAMARVPAGGTITMPEDEIEIVGFENSPSVYYSGLYVPRHSRGIIGSGRGTLGGTTGTVFRMRERSSTNGGDVPAQSTGRATPHAVIKSMSAQYPQTFAQFRIEGTDQGHIFSNMEIYNPPPGTICRDLLTAGWQGNEGAPPGETWALISGQSPNYPSGKDPFTDPSILFLRVEADGRRVIGGPSYGASGLSIQGTVNSRMQECKAHMMQASTMTTYLTFKSVYVDCIFDGGRNPAGYFYSVFNAGAGGQPNNERSADIHFIRCYMACHTKPDGTGGLNMTWSNDTLTKTLGGVTYTSRNGGVKCTDCTWNKVQTSGRPRSQTWNPYGNGDTMLDSNPPLWVRSDGSLVPNTWIHYPNTYQYT